MSSTFDHVWQRNKKNYILQTEHLSKEKNVWNAKFFFKNPIKSHIKKLFKLKGSKLI